MQNTNDLKNYTLLITYLHDQKLTASENGFSSINAPISRTTEVASTATEDEHNSNDNQFLTEEEIDEFIIAEQVAASE